MNKVLKIAGLTAASLITLVLVAALLIPLFFSDAISRRVQEEISRRVEADVSFSGYRLTLFRTFPNASFSLSDLSITGRDPFEGDTLASAHSLRIVINLKSLFGKEGYEIRSLHLEKPMVNAIVTAEGRANWDIFGETPAGELSVKDAGGAGATADIRLPDDAGEGHVGTPLSGTAVEADDSGLKLLLRRVTATGGRLRYTDHEADMSATADDLGFVLSGRMSGSRSDLDLGINAGTVNFIMDGIPWLSSAVMDFRAGIDAELDSMIFRLKDNVLRLNDISLGLNGFIAMPDDDIEVDLALDAPEVSFKSLLSLVPAFYMQGYEELQANGLISLDGVISGVYSSADSTLPDIDLSLEVTDGIISYPSLPERLENIAFSGRVRADGRDSDNSVVEVSRFHFVLAGSPFDMSLRLSTPVSDPSVSATARGSIDLAKLQQAVPLDSLNLSGLLNMSVELAGRLSMIEEGRYEQFRAAGSMSLQEMTIEMSDMPDLVISHADLTFSPARATLTGMRARVGQGSDFSMEGRLENYIPYLFSDGTVKGSLSLKSDLIDLNEIMGILASDTIDADTTLMEPFIIPRNIDFTVDARAGELAYGTFSASDLRGQVIIRDGTVTLNETGMKALGGSLMVNALYDTRDTLRPVVDAGLNVSAISIRDAFTAFNMVRQLMPAAAGMGGSVSARLDFSSLLGQGMMPLINTLAGAGELSSESVQIIRSESFDKIKGLLKMDPAYTNVVKDIRASFIINEGRVYIKPFDTRLGGMKLNISGDQGLDQTISYLVRAEIPGRELGEAAGALMSAFAPAAALAGMGLTPPEVIRMNFNVGGTFGHPVITPSFAGSSGSTPPVTALTDTVKSEVTRRLNEAAQQQADKLISEAEEKAELLRREAGSSAVIIRREADARGKKLVADAEAKGPIAVAAARKGAEALNREAEKKAEQLVAEADRKADELLEKAREKAEELLK